MADENGLSNDEIKRYAALGVELACRDSIAQLQRAHSVFPDLRKKHIKILRTGITNGSTPANGDINAGDASVGAVQRKKRGPMPASVKNKLRKATKLRWAKYRAEKAAATAAGMTKRKPGRPRKQPANVMAGA